MSKTKLLLLLFISASAFSQVPDQARLDSYFDALGAGNKLMGNISVSHDGKTVYSRSLGYADVESGKKINADSKFRIGSITKMFTTALVFKAVEEGKLKLTDNIGSDFPAVPNASKITVAMLLSHRSGIHNFTDDSNYGFYMLLPKTETEMVDIIAKAPSDFEPDSKAAYSNSNFVLLTVLVEKAFKKPYKDLINEKIIKPLGLKNTYCGGKIDLSKNETNSYQFLGKWEKQPETDLSIPLGAGAIVSNVNDLSRFIEGLFTGKIISMASVEQMKNIREGYGMGLFEFPFGDKTAYGHTGGIDGFSSMICYIEKDKVTFALTSNGRNMQGGIATTAMNWFYNKPFEVPVFKTFTYKAEELDPFLGTYASKDIPLGITVTKDGATLLAQATGQGAFPLEATDKNTFKFDSAGIVMEFTPQTGGMVLKQGGAIYTFTKNK